MCARMCVCTRALNHLDSAHYSMMCVNRNCDMAASFLRSVKTATRRSLDSMGFS